MSDAESVYRGENDENTEKTEKQCSECYQIKLYDEQGSVETLICVDPENCSICLKQICDKSEGSIATLPCGHEFHENCVREWFNKGRKSCPLCNLNCSRVAIEGTPVDNAIKVSNFNLQDSLSNRDSSSVVLMPNVRSNENNSQQGIRSNIYKNFQQIWPWAFCDLILM